MSSKRKRSPSDARRSIRRRLALIERLEAQRAEATGAARVHLDNVLAGLYEWKRATIPQEGAEFIRPYGKTSSADIIVARASRKREGEAPPTICGPRSL